MQAIGSSTACGHLLQISRAQVKAKVNSKRLRSLRNYATESKICTKYTDTSHPDEPVPENVKAILEKQARVTLNTYARPPLIFTRGKGMHIYDTQDRKYLDMSAGIAVNALGHADDGVSKILAEQSQKLVHCSNLYHNEWSGQLAHLLAQCTMKHGGLGYPDPLSTSTKAPEAEGLKVFLTNSGTEATEGALKFARKYGKTKPNKFKIVCFVDGFHGRSMGALSATMQEKYQKPFAPLVPGFVAGNLNDVEAIDTLVDEETCGVLVEPIQGEGGIIEANEPFLRALRKRCDQVNAALIFDEIQCGLGRTGKFWAHAVFPTDCHPDLLTMAKPLANGIPIGAILMRSKVADVVQIGDHGTTFGGAPLQTRVAHHVVTRLADPSFLDQVAASGEQLRLRLDRISRLFPNLIKGSVRGRGLILGLPFKSAEHPGKVVKLCRERGLLLLTAGNATVRFVPSLIATETDVNSACDILESALHVLSQEPVPKQPPSGQMQ